MEASSIFSLWGLNTLCWYVCFQAYSGKHWIVSCFILILFTLLSTKRKCWVTSMQAFKRLCAFWRLDTQKIHFVAGIDLRQHKLFTLLQTSSDGTHLNVNCSIFLVKCDSADLKACILKRRCTKPLTDFWSSQSDSHLHKDRPRLPIWSHICHLFLCASFSLYFPLS